MKVDLEAAVKIGKGLAKEAEGYITKNEHIQKSIFGTYSNGKPRNLFDALSGEIVSPEDKLVITKRLKKHEKKKKKKEKKGEVYGKIDLKKLSFNLDVDTKDEDDDDDDFYID